MIDSLRLIYMAGGAYHTIDPLRKLMTSKHNIVHTFCKSPKPSGRGNKIIANPLQIFLQQKNLSYSMPESIRSKEEIEKIKYLKPDLIIVFSYGNILPEEILNIPKWGCINIHASLLPKWRGASPVQYSLLNNDKETGFTIIIMNKKIDEGKILYKEIVKISRNDNSGTLLKKITYLASEVIVKIINKYVNGSIRPISQDSKFASYARIIKKRDTYLDFNDEADVILGKIKAFNPNPVAKCFINGELVKIFEAKKEILKSQQSKPGTILDGKLLISCKKDGIRPLVIQRAGKSKLKIEDALNGWKVCPGTLAANKIN